MVALSDLVPVQTVNQADQPVLYDVLREFEEKTGYGVAVNASFQLDGDPIVCTPYDAYRCFMLADIDVLVIENFLLFKNEQPIFPESNLCREISKGHDGFARMDDPFIQKLCNLYTLKRVKYQ